METFEEQVACDAPAEEVWKLLFDPARFPDWWAGLGRVEEGPEGEVVRYMDAWPDFAYPTRVAAAERGGHVVISCLISDIVHEWWLEPATTGCVAHVRVEVPDDAADKLERVRAEVRASLPLLAACARRPAGYPAEPM